MARVWVDGGEGSRQSPAMPQTLQVEIRPDAFSARDSTPEARPNGRDAIVEVVANDSTTGQDGCSLEALVYDRLRIYAESLQGHYPEDMYRLIMPQLERPLIQIAMELSGGEKKAAARMLGIHRNTLRARLRDLGMETPKAGRRDPR